jgi:hypothetical protein
MAEVKLSILNYEPESFFSEDELALVRSTFKDNPRLLQVLRKYLLPSVGIAELPLEELQNDIWLQGREWASIPADEAKILMVARQEAIKFIQNGIVRIKLAANTPEKSAEELAQQRKQDSTR